MSTSKPEAGQWWVNEKFGDKVYFIGRCANGIMVFQVEGNEIEHGDLDWSGWRLMQPEDTVCDECGGSGEVDSGGFTPWMAPISVPCGKCSHSHRILGDPAGGVTMQKQCAVGCHGPRCPNPALPGKDHCGKCADEPQPQKTRVRLWSCDTDGVIVAEDNCPAPGWTEIHHDSDGFYVEGGQS